MSRSGRGGTSRLTSGHPGRSGGIEEEEDDPFPRSRLYQPSRPAPPPPLLRQTLRRGRQGRDISALTPLTLEPGRPPSALLPPGPSRSGLSVTRPSGLLGGFDAPLLPPLTGGGGGAFGTNAGSGLGTGGGLGPLSSFRSSAAPINIPRPQLHDEDDARRYRRLRRSDRANALAAAEDDLDSRLASMGLGEDSAGEASESEEEPDPFGGNMLSDSPDPSDTDGNEIGTGLGGLTYERPPLGLSRGGSSGPFDSPLGRGRRTSNTSLTSGLPSGMGTQYPSGTDVDGALPRSLRRRGSTSGLSLNPLLPPDELRPRGYLSSGGLDGVGTSSSNFPTLHTGDLPPLLRPLGSGSGSGLPGYGLSGPSGGTGLSSLEPSSHGSSRRRLGSSLSGLGGLGGGEDTIGLDPFEDLPPLQGPSGRHRLSGNSLGPGPGEDEEGADNPGLSTGSSRRRRPTAEDFLPGSSQPLLPGQRPPLSGYPPLPPGWPSDTYTNFAAAAINPPGTLVSRPVPIIRPDPPSYMLPGIAGRPTESLYMPDLPDDATELPPPRPRRRRRNDPPTEEDLRGNPNWSPFGDGDSRLRRRYSMLNLADGDYIIPIRDTAPARGTGQGGGSSSSSSRASSNQSLLRDEFYRRTGR